MTDEDLAFLKAMYARCSTSASRSAHPFEDAALLEAGYTEQEAFAAAGRLADGGLVSWMGVPGEGRVQVTAQGAFAAMTG